VFIAASRSWRAASSVRRFRWLFTVGKQSDLDRIVQLRWPVS
jgi:hypothetical protein